MIMIIQSIMKIENKKLLALTDEIYAYYNDQPSYAKLLKGRYNKGNQFPDISIEGFRAQMTTKNYYKKLVKTLIEVELLNNYDLLAAKELIYFIDYVMYSNAVIIPLCCSEEKFFYLEFGLTSYNMPIRELWQSFKLFPCFTDEDAINHLELTNGYLKYTEQMLVKLKQQIEKGIYLYHLIIDNSIKNLRFLASFEYKDHPLSFNVGNSSANENQIQMEEANIHKANSNLNELADILDSNAYRLNAPKEIGLRNYVDGSEYYKSLRLFHLDVDIEAAELHRHGKELLVNALIQQDIIRDKYNFETSHEKFLEMIKDSELYNVVNAEDVEKLANYYLDMISKKLPQYISETIKTPYMLKRLDPLLESSLTFGYFDPSDNIEVPGIYYYNGSDLPSKCHTYIPPLISHEIIPGHHFQQSYISENEDLHPLLKEIQTGSYLEGWAEYASKLCFEMGAFDDFAEYGRLEMEKFACVRLIIDTGINELGWNFEESVAFMKKNTFATHEMAKSEVLRYGTSIPGQCLPYRFGRIQMEELRSYYFDKMGENGSLLEFHSLILNVGNVPMALLKEYLINELK